MALAKELNDAHRLALALSLGAVLGYFDRKPAEVDRLAAELVELSTRHHFAQIEAAFHQTIRTAQQQKSISLRKRAEAGLAAYRGR